MSFRCAISTLGCPDLTLAQSLALAGRCGIAGIEVRSLAGTIDLPRYLKNTYEHPATLVERLGRQVVKIVALDSSFKLVGGVAAERESLQVLVPWAEALGVRFIRVFDGGQSADDAEVAEAADTIGWWRGLRTEKGWKTDLMIETHDSLFTAASVARLLAAVPEVAILWDSHHTWKRGGEDPLVTWRALKPHIVHVHVKDSINRPSASHPYTYVLPGTGEFPAAPLLATLRREFTGYVCLEWERLWHPYLPPVEEAINSAFKSGWL